VTQKPQQGGSLRLIWDVPPQKERKIQALLPEKCVHARKKTQINEPQIKIRHYKAI
jgi:hypothetical protein